MKGEEMEEIGKNLRSGGARLWRTSLDAAVGRDCGLTREEENNTKKSLPLNSRV
ncbi:hypothetical protein HPP92_006242 [Vanilla planifolia]|uniref:Uncharacterized protein n=1 Tax=Vanilla planifolia TaxID=51239 RepID=A0A835RJZ1_VANPL|nr:hypothetical protein HPP92_006242 [Vanilla planifolia]